MSDKGKPVVGQSKRNGKYKKAIRHRSERELTEKSKRKKKNRRKM